jgi:hypothetical protein
MNDMDGLEDNTASTSRRLLLGRLLGATVVAGDAAKGANVGGGLSAIHHGAILRQEPDGRCRGHPAARECG